MVDVLYHDRPIKGSPFRCSVFDSSKVLVRNLPPVAYVGSSVEFDSRYRRLLSFNYTNSKDINNNNESVLISRVK